MREPPVVETQVGRLRGVSTDKLDIFKGIHYAETTAGKGRFRPPTAVKAWDGVREAIALGDACFQNNPNPSGWTESSNGSEDCLVLNVWSPRGAKGKPVMVFLHGGAYMRGSGGAPIYDAARLAERGDVVAITVNHRLHMLGFIYLADMSDDYKAASNAGLQDLVEALRWINRNISAFGGDPNNVTVFGESGGGSKVSCLLAMPSAVGLFHKAIVQSGSQHRLRSRESATADTRAALNLLNVSEDHLAALEAVPLQAVWDASVKVSEENVSADFSDLAFSPVLDGEVLPFHPGSPEGIAVFKDTPLLVGWNEAESTYLLQLANLFAPPRDGRALVPILRKLFPKVPADRLSNLNALVASFRKRVRDADPLHQLVAIVSELWMGRDAICQVEARASEGSPSLYMYQFAWREPCYGGAWATHGAELPFLFDTLEMDGIWGDTDLEAARAKSDRQGRRFALRDAVIDAWSGFARDGRPSSTKLPGWPAYTLSKRSTMRFDSESAVVDDPLGAETRKHLAELDVGVGS
jgi:para-nitrobenzyl esterase